MSRSQLGEKIDVTHQQLMKYESGCNRIAAGRLFLIAKALDTTTTWFFEDIENYKLNNDSHSRLGIEMAREFALIKSFDQKAMIVKLARTLR